MYPAQANRAEILQKPESIGERRQFLRHRVSMPAYAGVNGSPTAIALDLSEILDLSEEGICIQAASPLQVDRVVNLRLELSETTPRLNISGVVAWSEASGRTGIRLLDMPEAARRSLEDWLVLNALAAGSANSLSSRSGSEIRHGTPEPQPAPFFLSQRNVMPEVATMPGDSSLYGSATAGRDVKAAGSDLDLRLHRIAQRALTLTRASGAAIALLRNEQMICVARAGADAPSLGARIEVGFGLSGECVRSRQVLFCDDAETDLRVDREICRALGIRSILAVPICSGETVTGLLEVFSPYAHAFALVEPAPLERLGRDILLAIDWSAGITSSRTARLETSVRTWQPVSKTVVPAKPQSPDRALQPRPDSRSHKFVLAAAIVVLILTGAWLVTPWARMWIVSRGVLAKTPAIPKVVAKPVAPAVPPASDFENLRWLANQGDPTAQYALGRHYAQGEDVPQDDAEATRWFARAAEQGHIVAQATLGAWYWAGRGVPKDLNKAYFWLVLARAGGYERSNDLIGPITAEMTHSEVLAAQQEANNWLTHHQVTNKAQAESR
ncbi:MAG TPA: GAF domain-containing protein [Terriglobales bacterium]|nr:GAF domain-containing protein [Terriglobales bacterium]